MLETTVAELAATQYGVFARFQLLALGISDKQIERYLKSGVWIRLAPGVYGYPGHRTTWDRRLWVAYLAAGERAIVSHHSAAADNRVPGFPRRDLHLTVPHPDHQRVKGATVHQSRVLPAHHIVVLNGRRTTTLARTLVDLAPHLTLARLDHAYEHAIVTERLTYSKMARTFRELATPSRKGMTKLAHVLDERGPGYVAPASVLERMLHEVVELAGLPPLVRQHPLPGHHGVEGCVDGAHPEAKLIMEADGRRWHTRLANLAGTWRGTSRPPGWDGTPSGSSSSSSPMTASSPPPPCVTSTTSASTFFGGNSPRARGLFPPTNVAGVSR